MPSLLPGVSVIVCCRNGQSRIGRCLHHLFQLRRPNDEFPIEILLIDNRSTDDTVNQAVRVANESNSYSLRVITEPRNGVAFARETGILNSNYSVLIFCDDDNLLDVEYAHIAWQVLEDQPDVAIVGGNSIAESVAPLPDWFNEFSGQFAVQNVDYSGPLDSQTNHWTAGMVARTDVLQRLIKSGFRPIGSTGLPGFSGSCGEDTELCLAVRHWNWGLYYEGRLNFTHVISPDRLSRDFLVRQAENFGAASLANDAKRQADCDSWKNLIRQLAWYQIVRATVSLLVALPMRLREDTNSPYLSSWHIRFGRLRALWLNKNVYRKLMLTYREWYRREKPADSNPK